MTPRTAREWLALAPQAVGLFGLIFCLVFWAVTFLATGHGAAEPLFVTSFGGLLAAGQGAQAIAELKQPPCVPIPDKTVQQARKGGA